MGFILRVCHFAAILFTLHQSLALALNIPNKPSCGPGQRLLSGDNVCVRMFSSDGRNVSIPDSISSLKIRPLPPTPFRYTSTNTDIGITLTKYGAAIPFRQAQIFMRFWLDAYKDVTQNNPHIKYSHLDDDYGWSAGPVSLTLRPGAYGTGAIRWIDVYELITLLLQFIATYGLVEAEMQVVGIFPGSARPDIGLATASLVLAQHPRSS